MMSDCSHENKVTLSSSIWGSWREWSLYLLGHLLHAGHLAQRACLILTKPPEGDIIVPTLICEEVTQRS